MYSVSPIFKKKSFTISALIHIFLIVIIVFGIKSRKITIEKNKVISVNLSLYNEKEIDVDIQNQDKQLEKKVEKNDTLLSLPQPEENIVQKKSNLRKIPEPLIEETDKLNKTTLNYEDNKPSNRNYFSKEKFQDTYKKELSRGKVKDLDENNIENFDNSIENSMSRQNSIDEEALNNYKKYLKKKIQFEASKSYPRASFKKKEEGKVEIIFSLTTEGNIKEIKIGSNTAAPRRIIDSLIKVMNNKIAKFKKDKILKKTNTFSLIIVYRVE